MTRYLKTARAAAPALGRRGRRPTAGSRAKLARNSCIRCSRTMRSCSAIGRLRSMAKPHRKRGRGTVTLGGRQHQNACRSGRALERHVAGYDGGRTVHADGGSERREPGRQATCWSVMSSCARDNRTWDLASGRLKAAPRTPARRPPREIRQLNIGTNASLVPRQTFASAVRWVVGSPETVGNFSAACYYFARELKKTANTPVGIVVAAWGGAQVPQLGQRRRPPATRS